MVIWGVKFPREGYFGFFESKVGLPVTVPAQPGRQNFRCSKDSDFPSWLRSFSFFQFSWPYDREAWSLHKDLERKEKKKKCKVTNVHLDLENDLIQSLKFFSKNAEKSGGLILFLAKFGLISYFNCFAKNICLVKNTMWFSLHKYFLQKVKVWDQAKFI